MLLAVLTVFNGCENLEDLAINESTNDLKNSSFSKSDKEYYDANINDFAKTLAYSISDHEFRKLLKSEFMKKSTGDYEIIWKNIKNSPFKKGNLNLTIGEFIGNNYKNSTFGNYSRDEFYRKLNNFEYSFKNLQIAMPIHCNDWDIDNFEPLVAFIDSDFSEERGFINAYDGKGNKIQINSKIEPDYPVIVVGLSERTDSEGNMDSTKRIKNATIMSIPGEFDLTPPSNLAGTSSSAGIHLTWNYNGMYYPNLFEIQKNSGTGYVTIASVDGFERDYLDTNGLANGNTYYYRVRAYSEYHGYSIYSNAIGVTFIAIPSPPSNFTVTNTWGNQMNLTWSNTLPYSYNSSIILKRRSVGMTEWQTIATLPSNINSYIDNNVSTTYPDNKYHYQIYYQTGTGNSDAVFDVEYCTSRTNGQPIYLNAIAIPLGKLSEIESWVYGAPEFDITIATMNSNGTQGAILKDKLRYEPEYRWGGLMWAGYDIIYIPDRIILDNWDKNFAQSVMSINIVEWDGEWISGKLNINVLTKKPIKFKETGLIEITPSGSVELNFRNSDKNLSTEFYYFWENPCVVRHYGYGIKVVYSNIPQQIPHPSVWL
jgi:hypothetical protein